MTTQGGAEVLGAFVEPRGMVRSIVAGTVGREVLGAVGGFSAQHAAESRVSDDTRRQIAADVERLEAAHRRSADEIAERQSRHEETPAEICTLAREFAAIMREHGSPGAERRWKYRTGLLENFKKYYGRSGWRISGHVEGDVTPVLAS